MKNMFGNTVAAKCCFQVLMGLSLLFTFVACEKSPEEIRDDSGRPEIRISTVLTKALDDAFEPGDRIGVYVVKWRDDNSPGQLMPSGNYADNIAFTMGDTESEWTAAQKIYMPGDQSKVTLYAYYPYDEHMSIDQYGRFAFSINADQRDHTDYTASDLAMAKATASWTLSNVRLTFNHVLSQLVFAIEAGNGFGPDEMEHADIRILNSWTNTNVYLYEGLPDPTQVTTEDIIPGGSWTLSADGSRVTGKKAIFMPHQPLNHETFVQIRLGNRMWTTQNYGLPPLQPGESRILTFSLTPSNELNFTTKLNPWNYTVEENMPTELIDWDGQDVFIMEFDTRLGETPEIFIDIYQHEQYDFWINWGDGTIEKIEHRMSHEIPPVKHTYQTDGCYQVKISGICTKYRINSTMLTHVWQWGNLHTRDISEAFYGAKNLQYIADGVHQSESYERTFAGTGLTSLGSGIYGSFLFSKALYAKSFAHCFEGTPIQILTDNIFPPGISATDYTYIFANCPDLHYAMPYVFQNSSATDFSYAFYNCPKLHTAPSFQYLVDVKDFSYAFADCITLTNLPDQMFYMCRATDYNYTFKNCKLLHDVPSSTFQGNSNARNFKGTFYNSGIKHVLGLFGDCWQAVNYEEVFALCEDLETLQLGSFNGTNYSVKKAFRQSGIKVIVEYYSSYDPDPLESPFLGTLLTAESVFIDCWNLTEVNAPVFANLPNLTNVGGAFANCGRLVKVHEKIFWKSPQLKNYGSVFYGCSNLKGKSFKNQDGKEIWEIPGNMSGGAYYQCYGLSNFDEIPYNAK